MRRSRRLVITLSTVEQHAIAGLARAEKLPPSTLARRLLLLEADRRGLQERIQVEQARGAEHS